MRLIDADALIKKWENVHSKDMSFAMAIIGATNDVKKAPTIDAVPVIRCRECKWYYRGGATCMFWDGTNGMCGDDFYGRAERKEE